MLGKIQFRLVEDMITGKQIGKISQRSKSKPLVNTLQG